MSGATRTSLPPPPPWASTCALCESTARIAYHPQVVHCTHGPSVPVVAHIAVTPDARQRYATTADAVRAIGPHASLVPLVCMSSTVAASILAWSDFGNTTMHHLIKRRSGAPLPEWFARHLFAQLVSAVAHMHNQGYTHQRIACKNLLVASPLNDVVKLRDFTAAAPMGSDVTEAPAPDVAVYTAPEFARLPQFASAKGDVWMCGMVLYAFASGTLPDTDIDTWTAIGKGNVTLPAAISAPLADLILGMLRVDPRSRLTMADVKRHEWVQEALRPRRASLSEALTRRELVHHRFSLPARADSDLSAEFGTELEESESSGSDKEARTTPTPPWDKRAPRSAGLANKLTALLGAIGRKAS